MEPHKIGYARVSMVDQSPRLQIDALIAAGVDEKDIFVETASGAAKRRPQFAAMLREASAGDLVVIWKLDRLGRSTKQVLETFAVLDAKGAKIRVLTQPGMDTSTPMGRMILTVMAAVAELERDLIRERTLAGLAAAKARGKGGGATAKHSREAVLAAAKLGVRPGAKELGMSVSGFVKALKRAREQHNGQV